MSGIVYRLYRAAKRVRIIQSATNWLLRVGRRIFWSFRPTPDSAELPHDFIRFVSERIADGSADFTLLEVGCGDGRVLRHLAQMFPAARFVGVDIQQAAVAEGARVLREQGIRNVTLHCASCTDNSLSWSCDYLISRTALIYLDSREIEEFLRKRLADVRKMMLLEEIVSLTGATERSHFFAHPLDKIVGRAAPGLFSCSMRLLDYPPWKNEEKWSGADIVLARNTNG